MTKLTIAAAIMAIIGFTAVTLVYGDLARSRLECGTIHSGA